MELVTQITRQDQHTELELAHMLSEDGIKMSWAAFSSVRSRFAGQWIPSLCIGGVGTAPEYRRGGNVRKLFDYAFEKSASMPWAVALLHPFSSDYYRRMGFERVCDHRIITLPITALSHIPRYNELGPFQPDQLQDILDLYNHCSLQRNVTIERFDDSRYGNGEGIYVYPAHGTPRGYVKISSKAEFTVNRMAKGVLTVHEIVFSDPESLLACLGFLRMFEGELDTVRFENIAATPEVESILSEYTQLDIQLVPDVAARVLNTQAMLRANDYPKEMGAFTLRVTDDLPAVAGTFHVQYGAGKVEIERLGDDAACDLQITAPTLTQIMYGYENVTPETALYMRGVTLYNRSGDFFRAFPKRICGIYEHF